MNGHRHPKPGVWYNLKSSASPTLWGARRFIAEAFSLDLSGRCDACRMSRHLVTYPLIHRLRLIISGVTHSALGIRRKYRTYTRLPPNVAAPPTANPNDMRRYGGSSEILMLRERRRAAASFWRYVRSRESFNASLFADFFGGGGGGGGSCLGELENQDIQDGILMSNVQVLVTSAKSGRETPNPSRRGDLAVAAAPSIKR